MIEGVPTEYWRMAERYLEAGIGVVKSQKN
jgi:hypothetical protein